MPDYYEVQDAAKEAALEGNAKNPGPKIRVGRVTTTDDFSGTTPKARRCAICDRETAILVPDSQHSPPNVCLSCSETGKRLRPSR
jgi:hypothetical protein